MGFFSKENPLEKWHRRGLNPYPDDTMICEFCLKQYEFFCTQFAQSPYAQRTGRQLNQNPDDPTQSISMLKLGEPGKEKAWSMTDCHDSKIQISPRPY